MILKYIFNYINMTSLLLVVDISTYLSHVLILSERNQFTILLYKG